MRQAGRHSRTISPNGWNIFRRAYLRSTSLKSPANDVNRTLALAAALPEGQETRVQ